jgi:hypothetical protein
LRESKRRDPQVGKTAPSRRNTLSKPARTQHGTHAANEANKGM